MRSASCSSSCSPWPGVAAPGRTVGAFGPPATVFDPGCGAFLHSRAALGGDGIVRGWTAAQGPGCTGRSSPYQGGVLAAGIDRTSAYLLYRAAEGIRLTKRSAGGAFTAGRLLARDGLLRGCGVGQRGTWWAIWLDRADRMGPACTWLGRRRRTSSPPA